MNNKIHSVTLNYVPTGKPAPNDAEFKPDTNPVPVIKGDSITFQLGPDAPKGTFQLTFHQPEFFAAVNPGFEGSGKLQSGAVTLRVSSDIPDGTRISYDCELVVDGQVKARGVGKSGGEIIPDSKRRGG